MDERTAWEGDDTALVIKIANSQPVELVDLTSALLSFADQYRRYVVEEFPHADAGDLKLYIKEIRAGSIIATLVSYWPQASLILHEARPLLDFAISTAKAYNYFAGRSKEKPAAKLPDLLNYQSIVGPVAKDTGAQFNIHVEQGGNVVLNLALSSNDAVAVQSRIANQIAAEAQPVRGRRERDTFFWWQARNDMKAKTGDFGIIEAVSRKPVKVIFENEDAKRAMLEDSLFQKGFIIDVEVQTVRDRPAVYKIIKVHESFDLPDEGDTW